MHRTAYVIDVDARNILMEQKLEAIAAPTGGVGLDVLAIEEMIAFHQRLNVQGKLRLAAGIAERSEVDKASWLARWVSNTHGQIRSAVRTAVGRYPMQP